MGKKTGKGNLPKKQNKLICAFFVAVSLPDAVEITSPIPNNSYKVIRYNPVFDETRKPWNLAPQLFDASSALRTLGLGEVLSLSLAPVAFLCATNVIVKRYSVTHKFENCEPIH